MKVVSVVGARPQFIKCAPVSRELRKKHEEVLVYGDTNSTLAGALAAAKLHVKVAHVEAGLRSFDRGMPEEVNRVVTDHVSDFLFCPTRTAIDNLANEGITRGVSLVRDVMVDAMEYNRVLAEKTSRIIERLGLTKGKYLAVTVHRPSNTDSRERMADIISALGQSGEAVVFPVHPRTVKYLKEYGLLDRLPGNIQVVEPLGYMDMITLMASADKVVTDSGGVHKEAYMLKVPCITLRENTEWVEIISSGWNALAGANREKILEMIRKPKEDLPHPDLYGRDAARKIADALTL